MMTRAERAMELHAELYIANRLRAIANRIGDALGTTYQNTAKWPGSTVIGEIRAELIELKCQMGGSERRQYTQLAEQFIEILPKVVEVKS